jgi:putative PIN family toxin of toxin-antitoxin system
MIALRYPRRVRAVIDTNVVLSALLFGGGTTKGIRHAWMKEDVIPLVCTATALELIRTLAYPKFHLDPQKQRKALSHYLPFCSVVEIPDPPPLTPPCRDPLDIIFLQLAIAGNADLLITGDSALLELHNQVSFDILTPAEFFNAQ